MHAAVVTIGDEILSGHTQDTNSHFISGRLYQLGVPVVERRTVPDIAGPIQGAVWELQERRDVRLVVTLGGLGPTHDDRTVSAVARMHGAPLTLHPATWERLTKRYGKRYETGDPRAPQATAAARKMALVPRGAEVFPNDAGAAPGLAVARITTAHGHPAWTILLPGVPQEMHTLWTQHIEAFVAAKVGTEKAARHVREVVYHGFESEAAAILERVEAGHEGVAIGSYPRWGERLVILRASGLDAARVAAAAASLVAALREAGHDAEPGAANP